MFKAKDYQRIFNLIPDHPQKFPKEIKTLLSEVNLLKIVFTKNEINRNNSDTEPQDLLGFLFEIGKGNLSVGRIIEGHVNALMLINTFGTVKQKEEYFKFAKNGALFGVWNTELPKEKVKFKKMKNDGYLNGIKTYCSGGLNLDYAIVTAQRFNKTYMFLINAKDNQFLDEEWSQWNPIGMRASVSSRIHFNKIFVNENQLLGKENDYFMEPHFSWGGTRFSTIQLGAAQVILEEVIKDLTKRNRTSNAYQKQRLGRMSVLLKGAKFWITETEQIEQGALKGMTIPMQVNFANMMRSATLNTCEEILLLAEKAIGIRGSMMEHPLEQKIRDLRVYLKQARPDAILASVGDFIVNKKCYD